MCNFQSFIHNPHIFSSFHTSIYYHEHIEWFACASRGLGLSRRVKKRPLLAGERNQAPCQAPSISSRVHVNGCKNFIPVQVHTGLGSFRSRVNTPLVEPPALVTQASRRENCREQRYRVPKRVPMDGPYLFAQSPFSPSPRLAYVTKAGGSTNEQSRAREISKAFFK